MGKTIRNVIRQRVWAIAAAAFSGWPLLVLSGTFVKHQGPRPIAFLGFLLFMGAVIGLNFFVKCPKCFSRLGHTIAMPVAFGGKKTAPNFCPFCGASLDDPMPSSAEPSEADGVTTPDKLIWK